ncbi:SpoIIE family protein phosphatase [Streptomyces sp. NPDC006458]|uniref:ATP-binding SpoIIE family protein phosphatase n=1 Tax=Streptomyces sp. NPDC006458 TaxID=3154302 RepID=UPI0033BD2634
MGGSTTGEAGPGVPLTAVATALLDARGTVVRWSAAAAALIGRPADEVCGRRFRALLDAPGEDDLPTAGPVRLRHRNGGRVDVILRPVPQEPSTDILVLLAPASAETGGGAGTEADDSEAFPGGGSVQRRSRRERDLLHAAATRIGGSLDAARTAQDLVNVLVPALGDLASVELADGVLEGNEPPRIAGTGSLHLRRTAVAAVGGIWPAHLTQPGQTIPPVLSTSELRDVQHGRAAVFSRDKVAALFDSPEQHRLAIPERGHSALWAPLFARGLVLGTIAVWRTDQLDEFDHVDADLLTEIASRAALSVDNARRYTREHRSVLALQQRLLPEPTTDAPAAETHGLYLPTRSGAGISGDWYDVIPLPSLRVALVVGDVAGHGLYATATMGRLRTAVRTLADLELDPTELLTHLDDLVQQFGKEADPAGPFVATCLYAVYDPITRRCSLASAGHPPPVVTRPDGTTEAIEVTPGPPLGVGGMPFESTTVDLAPDSVLALYTDGLIERHDTYGDGGLRWLINTLADSCRPGHPLEDAGRALLADLDGAPPRDDIAVLLARTRVVAAEHMASWEFPAEPSVVSTARRVATEQLATWGLEDMAFTTELIISELVTNAVRYAGGPVGLRLIRENALICEVTDPSNTQPRLRRARWSDEGGRGLFLIAQLARRWGSRYGRHGKTIWTEQPLAPAEFDPMTLL